MHEGGRRRRLGWVACLSLAAAPAFGQPGEALYGGTSSFEWVTKLKPVVACPGGGYVMVGTHFAHPLDPSRVYVLRVRANGATMWERTYSVNYDESNGGISIAEARDGSGFYVAGYARFERSREDVLLMKIGCDGLPWWAWTYDSIDSRPQDEFAFDVVEAEYGDPATGTQPGDILVAGRAEAPNFFDGGLGEAGFLMRTRSSGVLIWNRRYASSPSPSEHFRALIEAKPAAGKGAGDVVAVGRSQAAPSEGHRGYAVRVSGNTGLIEASPHGAARYGEDDWVSFDSVVELRAERQAGHLAMVGQTIKPPGPFSGIYLARTAADPTVVKAQRRIGESWWSGHDVREVQEATTFARAGDLAVTGGSDWLGVALFESSDAFLLLADPESLEPIEGTGRLYGDHGSSNESGASMAVHPGGFVFTGYSERSFGDPREVYLVSTDRSGHTSCDLEWRPESKDPALPVVPVTPTAESFLGQTTRDVWSWTLDAPGRGGCLSPVPRLP